LETVVDTQFNIGGYSKVIHFQDGGGRLWIENYIDNYQRHFLITDWHFNQTRLLSRNSQALRNYQIVFKGYEGWSLGIKQYNEWEGGDNNGWEIFPLAPAPPVPEPTTYGAIFGTVVLGLVTWRRRNRSHATASRFGKGIGAHESSFVYGRSAKSTALNRASCGP